MRALSLCIFWVCVFTSMHSVQSSWGCSGICEDGTVLGEGFNGGCGNGDRVKLFQHANDQGIATCVSGCERCEQNTFTDEGTELSFGVHCQMACVPCSPGTYSTYVDTQFKFCNPCGIEKYRAAGDASCLNCPPHTTTETEISSSVSDCIACLPGSYYKNDANGTKRCEPCGKGLYRGAGDASCLLCPEGMITLSAMSSSISDCGCSSGLTWVSDECVPCLPGTYSEYNNQTIEPCTPCGTGLYRGVGDASCLPCPEGMITQNAISSSFSDCGCPSGLTLVSDECVPCLPGTYAAYDLTKIQPDVTSKEAYTASKEADSAEV